LVFFLKCFINILVDANHLSDASQ